MPKQVVAAQASLETDRPEGAEPEVALAPEAVVLEAAPPAPPGPPEPGFEEPPVALEEGDEPVLPSAPVPESLASQVRVVEPEPKEADAVPYEPPAPVVPVKAVELPQEWRFVKNHFPGEVITFKDGSTFNFTKPKRPGPAALLVTRNPEFAQKILAVADSFGIVQQ